MNDLEDALKRVAVIGAAGKMGSGIAALLLQEMARSEAQKNGKVGTGEYVLTLIDANPSALISLRKYLRDQILKYAERNINSLREYYANNPDCVSNEEIIRAFVEGAIDCIQIDEEVSKAKDSKLVFEAILEDVTAKNILFNTLKATSKQRQYYFTNTSSIPISLLNEASQLDNRIIGFHFYNPPIVQKLVEVISPAGIDPKLHSMALELAKRLQKIVVPSKDIAGFIGNGHLVREVMFACKQAKELAKSHGWSLEKAIYLVNRVTQDYLIRPMGIFQLMDYVGLDVCRNVAKIMSTYLPDSTLHDDWLDKMVGAKVIGGQNPDGSQKNGCLKYEGHKIKGIYDIEGKKYQMLADTHRDDECDKILGVMPEGHISWKKLQVDPEKDAKIDVYMTELRNNKTFGAQLAQRFIKESQRIGKHLVETGVAEKIDDVDAVLKNGFFHLYGIGRGSGIEEKAL